MTAVDIAQRIRRDPKWVRGTLRRWKSQGHPLLQGHAHNDGWWFSENDALTVMRQLRAGDWRGTPVGAEQAVVSPVIKDDVHVTDLGGPSAQEVADLLVSDMPVAAVESSLLGLPGGPALYAWWARPGTFEGLLQRQAGVTVNDGLELSYIGIGSLREIPGGWRSPRTADWLEHAPASAGGLVGSVTGMGAPSDEHPRDAHA